jgi:hypothetical protein
MPDGSALALPTGQFWVPDDWSAPAPAPTAADRDWAPPAVEERLQERRQFELANAQDELREAEVYVVEARKRVDAARRAV